MSIKKISKSFLLTALIIVITASASLAAPESKERTVLTVGSVTLSEAEILSLIAGNSGGNEMMTTLMLSQSSLDDRRNITNQISEAVLFAEAAKGERLDQQPDIAFQIKWQTIQVLLQAYFDRVASAWDFSSATAKKYYNDHKEEFVQTEAVMAAHILTETEQDAIIAAIEAAGSEGFAAAVVKYSRDPQTAMTGGELGWVEKDMMVAPVEKAIMNGKSGEIVGPVQSEYGWHVIKIGERRPRRQLAYEETGNAVFESMQVAYIEQELQNLRAKYPVTVDDEALKTLGGIPAPAE